MRITPLEIRQHTFDKSFRGYDIESVDAFLLSLSQEWERISEDLRSSKQQLVSAEKEILRMKEIENSLFKTLKAAEDVQQNINAKAEAEANLITDKALKEVGKITEKALEDAQEIMNEAQKNADMLISESQNKAKFLVDEALYDLKNYERDFKAMERYKDHLVVELKSFANDALDKVTKFEERINSRSNEARLHELDIKASEKLSESSAFSSATEREVVSMLSNTDYVELASEIPDAEGDSPFFATSTPTSVEFLKPEIDFELAIDFDDENEELSTRHVNNPTEVKAGLFPELELNSVIETPNDIFNETADSLTKEMKATRGRPRKLTTSDGLPTVSSVMEEFSKDGSATILNGGGSFFDNL